MNSNGATGSFFGSDWLGAFLIIAVLFGGFGGFDDFGFSSQRSPKQEKGKSLRIRVQLTLEELFNGVKKDYKIKKYEKYYEMSVDEFKFQEYINKQIES